MPMPTSAACAIALAAVLGRSEWLGSTLAAGTISSDSSARPARHSTQFAIIGQVIRLAVEPTTRPKWPPGRVTS